MVIRLAVDAIRRTRERVPVSRSALVAVSGIDASGKGFVAARLGEALAAGGLRLAVLGADGWLNLPPLRFDPARPAERFYEHAIRCDEMFTRLVVPFREARACRVLADYTEEAADAYRPHVYDFGDTDVILLEGIFLLKQDFRRHYDLSFWVDCTFETALERAVRRGQEGLAPAETVRMFRTTYFPAQRLHGEGRASRGGERGADQRPAAGRKRGRLGLKAAGTRDLLAGECTPAGGESSARRRVGVRTRVTRAQDPRSEAPRRL